MKKRLLVVLALVIAFCMALAACNGGGGTQSTGSDDSAGAGTGSGSTDSGQAASNDKVWEVAVAQSHGEPVSPGWKWCFEEVEKRSDGRLKMTIYWSGSLVSVPEIPKSLGEGVATFSNVPSNNFPDVLPLNTRVLQLPFMGLKDGNDTAEIYTQLLSEFPEMIEEFNNIGIMPLGTTCLGYYGMHFTDPAPVHLPEDLNGKQVIPYNLQFMPLLEANNASGSYIPPGQAYESLEKGVVNGYINSWAFQGWFGLTDLMSSHTNFGDYGAFQDLNILALNLDFYNELPADLQQIWRDVMMGDGEGYKKMWQDQNDLVSGEQEKAAAKGDTVVTLTQEELEIWKELIIPEHQAVLDDINGKRGDTVATDIYNRVKEIVAERYGS